MEQKYKVEQIFTKNYARLCVMATAILHDSSLAQDAVQEGWIRLHKAKQLDTSSEEKLEHLILKQFDVVYLLTQQAGAKTGANIHTILTYAYENAFITNNYGYSSAVSILIFAILILFSMVTSRKAKEG